MIRKDKNITVNMRDDIWSNPDASIMDVKTGDG